MPTDLKVVKIYIDEELYLKFKEFCHQRGCSMSLYGELLIAEFISKVEKENG